MVKLTINDIPVEVEEGTTILDAAKKIGVNIPTLCYLKEINEIAACRICVVELVGLERFVPACNTLCTEGMEIRTNSPQVNEVRRTNLNLLVAGHRTNCPVCERNNSCQLHKVAVGLDERVFYSKQIPQAHWDEDFPIIRDESKCIKCWRCVSICEKVQTVSVWDMVGTGIHTTVGVTGGRSIRDSDCVMCGQCITHCPVNALHARNDIGRFYGMHGVLHDPDKVIVAQVAPAVRAAWGEAFGLPPEFATEKRLVTCLKRLGMQYVFDTNFSADLTIIEEGNEFLRRYKERGRHKWPMFTSCCPAWVRFLKSQYPDMVEQLSTAKSPQAMFGAVTKSWFAKKMGIDPNKIICVSIMPCTAKKGELEIPNLNDACAGRDVDFSLTTRELCRMIEADQIDVAAMPETEFDSPLGEHSGAGVIFGATGGVMEAALRTCSYILTGENPDPDSTFMDLRGDRGWKEANYNIAGNLVRTAVVSGLGNARKLIRAIRRGEVQYDFVEVMACPGGCAGGGGQPIHYNEERAAERGKVLYDYDAANTIRFSHENPQIQTLYSEYLGEPGKGRAHHLLHTDHSGWKTNPPLAYDEDVVVR